MMIENNKKEFGVITLCGSTKFKDDFMKIAEKLTLDGNIVLMPCVYTKDPEFKRSLQDFGLTSEDLIKRLEEVHFVKIAMSDAIFVINKDGYIGEGTQREIDYAEEKHKIIMYLENPKEVSYEQETEKEI